MKKYNRERRNTRNARAHAQSRTYEKYDERDGRDRYARIQITPRYDTHNRDGYIADVYRRTRDTHAQEYVGMTNAMREIFPEMDTHTEHVYRGTAPYKQHILTPPDTPYTPPREQIDVTDDLARVKCVIFKDDEIIHMGVFIRTRTTITKYTVSRTETHTVIKLHRGDRSIEVRAYIPPTPTIHGLTLSEIRKHGVELYHI